MNKKFRAGFCTVYTEKGIHRIMKPDGTDIPFVQTTVVTDDCRTPYEIPKVKATILCNLAKDREDALRLYKENQETNQKASIDTRSSINN